MELDEELKKYYQLAMLWPPEIFLHFAQGTMPGQSPLVPLAPEQPKAEMQETSGFPTVNPQAEDLGLGKAQGGQAGDDYVKYLLAAQMPVAPETGMMSGAPMAAEGAGFMPKNPVLSPEMMKALSALAPQAPQQPRLPGFIGGGPGPSQVSMAPMVRELALRNPTVIPTLAQLLGLRG